jgi:hypothetical protein
MLQVGGNKDKQIGLEVSEYVAGFGARNLRIRQFLPPQAVP